LSLTGPAQEKPAEPKLKRVLVITGRDVPVHNWRETTPAIRDILEQTKLFEVVVSEEPLVLESSALDTYDAVLLNYYNWQRPGLSEKARENLLAFVKGGKGLISVHFSVRAFEDWPEYRNLVGRIWTKGSGHGPRGPFKIRVAAKDDPITAGMSDFETDDELYAKLVGDAPIQVLIEADSDWSQKTEPLAWTHRYGQGRVFTTLLGHDVKAHRNAQTSRLLQRGAAWAANARK
jgi:type 1 glutamine amidotransferase